MTLMTNCSGYMSPEYAMHGVFSIKSDVYSFGVLLHEIVSGKKNSTYDHPETSLSLLPHVSTNKHQFQNYQKLQFPSLDK